MTEVMQLRNKNSPLMELSNQEVKLPDNTRVLRENTFWTAHASPIPELAVNAFMAQFGLMLRIFQFVTPKDC